jgi:hypothetical protein
VTNVTDTLKYDPYTEQEEWKRRKGEARDEEAKDVGQNSKHNDP